MIISEKENNLIYLYGKNVFKDIFNEIKELKNNSNIPFDEKYLNLSLSFFNIKVEQIINGEKEKCSLRALVSESFGEATMYKYNCCNGVL